MTQDNTDDANSGGLGGFLSEIKDALNNLKTLEIVTAVGQVTRTENPRFIDIDWDKDPKVALTKIDLLQGDITTVYDSEFVTGNYQSLKQFHADREKEGHEIIRKNIDAVKALGNLVLDATKWGS